MGASGPHWCEDPVLSRDNEARKFRGFSFFLLLLCLFIFSFGGGGGNCRVLVVFVDGFPCLGRFFFFFFFGGGGGGAWGVWGVWRLWGVGLRGFVFAFVEGGGLGV